MTEPVPLTHLEAKLGDILINGLEEYPIPLPMEAFTAGALADDVCAYCSRYGIACGTTENVVKVCHNFMQAYFYPDKDNQNIGGTTSTTVNAKEQSFWQKLLGQDPEDKHKPALYEIKDCLASKLQESDHFITVRQTDTLLVYCNGVYVNGGEHVVKEGLRNIAGSHITLKLRNEVIALLKEQRYAGIEDFDANADIVNVKNGLLNLRTCEFVQHDPEHLSLVQLPVAYDAKAICPKFTTFLREVIEPEHISIVVKLLGYLMLKRAIYHKAFQFVGEGSNGKSTLINSIKAFLGGSNVSNKSLQEITHDRFAKAELHGKMANLFADIPDAKLTSTGDFKMLVSGDPISAQRKFGQPFTFENYAKMVFSANRIPQTDDKSYAYFRRWVIIPFNRTFEGDDADEYLLEKLTTSQELSGILNLALKGLKKLRDERGFKEMDLEEIKHQYELGASRIKSFLEEQCIVEPGNENLYVETGILKEAYRTYCRDHGTSYYDETKFGRELVALGITNHQSRKARNIDNKRPHCYFGICLKSGRLAGSSKIRSLDCTGEETNIIEVQKGVIVGSSPEPSSRQEVI
jgi:P4 family phage/plasmid primase-like protien